MIAPALICGGIIWVTSSCNKENNANNANSALNFKAIGFLEEPTTKSYLAEGRKIDTLLFKGENIEWYNATTSEIKFKSLENTDVSFGLFGGLVSLIVCQGETELFTLDGAISSVSSISYNHPVLIHGGENHVSYYIGRGYPNWEYWTEEFWTETNWDRKADWVKEREKNWKAIEQGWNIFIEKLKEEDKYRK